MRIFLSGGNGMVGRNIHNFAQKYGHCIDSPTRNELNLLDAKATEDYLIKSSPDIVIHAAGLVGGIQANIAAPYDYCFHNLKIGMNLVQASYNAGIKQLLNIGSSCMYPRVAQNPLRESSLLTGELEPTNEGYAIAKVAVAKLAEYISKQYGVAYKTIIPCNLYGLWDKFDVTNSHMIPAVIRKIHEAKLQDHKYVEIWGDGTVRREFLFTEDLVDFIFFALERFDCLPNQMNVGLGFDYSINEYYSVIRDVLAYKGDFKHNLEKPIGMKQKLVDISIQKDLGWYPKTDLKKGIEHTYQFFLTEGK